MIKLALMMGVFEKSKSDNCNKSNYSFLMFKENISM